MNEGLDFITRLLSLPNLEYCLPSATAGALFCRGQGLIGEAAPILCTPPPHATLWDGVKNRSLTCF